MRRYIITTRIAVVAGLVSAAALALAAVPGDATLLCPPGITTGPYCTNLPPTATTGHATAITTSSATLNGVSGPGVAGGDLTLYFFQYGKTTKYGAQTPTGIACPAGVTNPNQCPSAVSVSAALTGLKPGQTYHFRIVSTNVDGTSHVFYRTSGDDQTFTTLNVIKSVKVKPTTVKGGKPFTVVVTLRLTSHLNIALLLHGKVVKSFNEGIRGGTVHKAITAPKTTGGYIVRVKAIADGSTQTVDRNLKVT